MKFFDEKIKYSKIGDILEKEKFSSYGIVNLRLKKKYFDFFEEKNNLDNFQCEIIDFKVNIDNNINFYDALLRHLKLFIEKINYSNLEKSKKEFFLNLLTLFPDQKELKKKASNVFLYKELDYYKNLRRKIKMIKLELICFNEIYLDYLNLLNRINEENILNETLTHKIKEVENLEKEFVGFFKKQTKKDKLLDLKNKLENCIKNLEFLNNLFEAVGGIIFKKMIPFIKNQKKTRFFEITNLFAKSNINMFKANINFWEKLIECQKDLKN